MEEGREEETGTGGREGREVSPVVREGNPQARCAMPSGLGEAFRKSQAARQLKKS